MRNEGPTLEARWAAGEKLRCCTCWRNLPLQNQLPKQA